MKTLITLFVILVSTVSYGQIHEEVLHNTVDQNSSFFKKRGYKVSNRFEEIDGEFSVSYSLTQDEDIYRVQVVYSEIGYAKYLMIYSTSNKLIREYKEHCSETMNKLNPGDFDMAFRDSKYYVTFRLNTIGNINVSKR